MMSSAHVAKHFHDHIYAGCLISRLVGGTLKYHVEVHSYTYVYIYIDIYCIHIDVII